MNLFKLVFKNIFRQKGRFVFTLLGIVIGVASFVAMLTIGWNMQNEVRSQAQRLGGDIVIVPDDLCVYNQIGIITGQAISESLSFDAFERISAIDGITVVPFLTQRTAIQLQETVVVGILPDETKAFRNWQMLEGRYFSSAYESGAVIGISIRNRFDFSIGDVLTIRGETFPIIGILDSTNSNDDTSVYLPLSIVQRIFDREGLISYMMATVYNMANLNYYVSAIINTANVNVATNDQLLDSALSILSTVTSTLQLVAGVALLAAAFGIINTMMTAVFERRREIGVLQAIGAKRKSIFGVFILESTVYGLLGGIIGAGIGSILSIIAAPIIAANNQAMLVGISMGASLNPWLLLMTIGVSVGISILSGLFPAYKAAKMTPVEAISYGK